MAQPGNCLPDPSEKVVVALSGGVDSSVTAWRLRERGHPVCALFMKNWEEDDREGYCAAAADLADAENVCRKLDIELRTVNFATEYWDSVFTHFLDEYRSGRTPNPDVLCNREIKFDVFMDFALQDGARWLATGHYARLQTNNDAHRLLKAVDENKDQTYFLHSLRQSQLHNVTFPLGCLSKDEVRQMARRAGLPTSEKKDSTGICFIGERPFKRFLSTYLPQNPGPIVNTDEELVGEHDGLAYYTPGQRQGLGIGGRKNTSGEPWYVVEKHTDTNTLVVAQGRAHPRLYGQHMILREASWISSHAPVLPMRCTAKLRHRHQEQPCELHQTSAGLELAFDAPQWAPAPGQSAVLYDGAVCLGGGVIERIVPATQSLSETSLATP